MTTVITRFEELEAVSADWDQLWSAGGRREIFGRFAWVRAWWRAYGHRRRLRTPAVFDGARLVGLVPLVVDGRTWRFLGAPGTDYNDMLCQEARAADVLRDALAVVASQMAAGERCELENISEHSLIAAHWARLPAALRGRVLFRRAAACPTAVIGDAGAVARIIRKDSLRRHENRLARLGRLHFRHIVDRGEIRRHLPEFFRQHVARRAVAGQRSVFLEAPAREFCLALTETLDTERELRFATLELDDRPIAYHFGFQSDRKLIWYKPSFDVAYWEYSPGEVLLRKLFEYARAERLEELDFTGGSEAFKNRFATRVDHTYALHLYRPGASGRALQVAHRCREQVKEWPAVYGALRAWSARAERWRGAAVDRLHRDGVSGVTRKLAVRCRRRLFARDEVLVFCLRAGESDPPPAPAAAADGWETGSASLADFAEVSVRHRDYLDAARLQRIRERLKGGERPYVVRGSAGIAHVMWTAMRTEIRAAEVGAVCRIPLAVPSVVAFDAWTAPEYRSRGLFQRTLAAAAADARARRLDCWCYCRTGNAPSRRVIEKIGFQLTHRMRRVQVVGFSWSVVEQISHQKADSYATAQRNLFCTGEAPDARAKAG